MVRTDFTKALVKDMYKWYFEEYDPIKSVYPKFLKEEESNAAYEQSTSAIGMGELTEVEEGGDIPVQEATEGFTTYGKNIKFGRALTMTEETVDDHQKIENLLKKTAGTWGEAVILTLERYYGKMFLYGGYTSGHAYFNESFPGAPYTYSPGNYPYDSVPLFNLSDNTRSSKGGGTYYNGLALDLNPDNLETAWNRMVVSNAYNERDEEISLRPDTLVVPPQLIWTARRILESTLIPGSDHNDKNVLQNLVTPIEWDMLRGDSNCWYLGCAKKGLIAQKRKAPKIDFYYDEDHEIYKAKISMRYGKRIDNFRFWIGSNFATS